jgi:hypothetical protein
MRKVSAQLAWAVVALASLDHDGSALALDAPIIVNAPSEQVGVFSRPTAKDAELIKIIAQVGAPRTVYLPTGANVARFVAERCGRPSATLLMHPAFEDVLLSRNANLKRDDLASLPAARVVEIPACAPFSEGTEALPAPKGIEALAANQSIPFTTNVFRKVASDAQTRARVRASYSGQPAGEAEPFAGLAHSICSDAFKLDVAGTKYPGCLNAIEIVALNPHINDPDVFQGPVVLPALAGDPKAKDADLQKNLVRIALKPGALTADLPQLKALEGSLQFVTEVKNPKEHDPDCSDAATTNRDAWPYNVQEFLRVLRLSEALTSEQALKEPGKILVVDSGFDFSDGEHASTAKARLAFPPRHFHFVERESDPKRDGDKHVDKNGDGIIENGGWSGVNLTGNEAGTANARSSSFFEYRAHGLAVLAIALGGRDLEPFRGALRLPVKIAAASLVPKSTQNPSLHAGHLNRAVRFAAASTNNFDVINLSLASAQEMSALTGAMKEQGRGKIVVVAAGNDKKPLNTNKVWPAVLGGKSNSKENEEGVFITVGAHDGKKERARFSNLGSAVDILAPGCMVPAYDLVLDGDRNVAGFEPQFVTGTSFAAPLVSFVSALLLSNKDVKGRPGLVKTRIVTATDYKYVLLDETFSAGVLNVAKALAFEHDVLEMDEDGNRRLRFGKVTLKNGPSGSVRLKCSAGREFELGSIRKIARDGNEAVLVFVHAEPDRPDTLTRELCDPASLAALTYDIEDAEDGRKITDIRAIDAWDYVRRMW